MLNNYEVDYVIRGTWNTKASTPQEAEQITQEDLEFELSSIYFDNIKIETEQVKELD